VTQRVPEGLDRLARQDAARGVGDRAGDHDRQARQALGLALGQDLVDREHRGLGVQRVEDGLDQQDVDAAFDQRPHLLGVGLAQLVEAHVARARVVDVGRDRRGLRLRADRAGHEARPLGRREPVAGLAREPGRGQVHLAGQVREPVVALGDGRCAEGVGLDDVGPGGQVLLVDLADDLGLRERQQLVVALDVVPEVGEALAAVGRLVEPVALDHGPHRAVEDQDPVLEQFAQTGFGRVHRRRAFSE